MVVDENKLKATIRVQTKDISADSCHSPTAVGGESASRRAHTDHSGKVVTVSTTSTSLQPSPAAKNELA